MADRFDLLRSLLRTAAAGAARRVRELSGLEQVRGALAELGARRVVLDEAALGAAIARAPGVREATARTRDGRLLADVVDDEGAAVAFAILPGAARFAARGAKEIELRVEPPERAELGVVRAAVGAIAGAIAHAVWRPALRGARPGVALTERLGGVLRVDLRSLPEVRDALSGGPLAVLLEVVSIARLGIDDRGLSIELALPVPPVGR